MNPTSAQPLRTLVIVLMTLATAFIHISLLFPDPVFILNGLGYLAFLGAIYLAGNALVSASFGCVMVSSLTPESPSCCGC